MNVDYTKYKTNLIALEKDRAKPEFNPENRAVHFNHKGNLLCNPRGWASAMISSLTYKDVTCLSCKRLYAREWS